MLPKLFAHLVFPALLIATASVLAEAPQYQVYIQPDRIADARTMEEIEVGIRTADLTIKNGISSWGLSMSKSRAHLLRGEALGGRRFFPEVVFTVHPKAIPTVLEIFEKALIWDNTAQKQRVNSFTKNMTPEGQEGIWSFSYDSDSQASTLYADNGFGTNVRLSITDVKKYTQLYTHFS